MTRLPSPPPPEVVDRDDRLAELARGWLREAAVGLDTEFVRERTFFPRLGLIQVADSAGCYLVDTVAIRDRSGLAEVIRSNAVTKVFHSPSEDLEILHHVFGFAPERLFDCQIAGTLCGLGGSLGYVHLVSRLFGVELEKGVQRSNWLRRPLSGEQVRYAGLDVAYLLPAYEQLRARLAAKGREAWAEEEFDRLLRAAEARLDPEWSFKRLGRPGMSRRQLAALRAVCEWRERRARRRDLPRGFVLKDETVIDLARRIPRNRQDLAAVKGLGPRQARRYGPALLDSLRAALALPDSDLPRRLERSGGRSASRLTERLRQLVARVAGDLDLPAETLVSRRTLEAWAARSLERGAWVWPGEIEGWRRSVLEPQLDSAGWLGAGQRSRSGRGRARRGRGGRGTRTAAVRNRRRGTGMKLVEALPHTIGDLYGLFHRESPPATVVPASAVPQPQRSLLAHESHMTVTLEEHHGGSVEVVVLDRVLHEDHYARRILLRRAGTAGGTSDRGGSAVVQFGIVLFNLRFAPGEARRDVLSEKVPLGHVLIRHRQLRRISTHSLLEIEPDAEMCRHFGLAESAGEAKRVYGRLATIFCDERPAVELLEVLPPGPAAAVSARASLT